MSHYPQPPATSDQDVSSTLKSNDSPKLTPRRGFRAQASTLWSLILHCLVALGIALLMIYYVNGRHFNLTERKPLVPLLHGAVRLSRYVPLQSDVTTFLSTTLVVLRLVTAAWAASLCWRCIFFLMEKTGLRRRDLDSMISYGFFTPFSYGRDSFTAFRVVLILLATLSAQAMSPILTGSITWIPSSQPVELQAFTTMGVSGVPSQNPWDEYTTSTTRREWTVRQASGYISLAWGRNVETGVMKRILPAAANLNINSTITNVTLPYFSVSALEWIQDPQMTLPPEQLNITKIVANMSAYGAVSPLQYGVAAFISDAPWNVTTLSIPPSFAISETRIVIVYTHWLYRTPCRPDNSGLFTRFPPNIGFLLQESVCYAFARVTFTAGSGVCTNCRVSSYTTVQNDTALFFQDDPMTMEALRLMADTAVFLVQMNSSIPTTTGDFDDYVIGVLTRSYAGAWMALSDFMGRFSPALQTHYSASIPSLQARVDLRRVYAWLAIQLLVTLSGVTFLLMQSKTNYQLVGNTSLAAFDLDTTAVTTDYARTQLKAGGLMRLEDKNGGLKVVIQAPESAEKDIIVRQSAIIRHIH